MEELVAVLAGNLEEHEALPRDNPLMKFAAVDDGSKLHGSPPELCLLFPVEQFVSERFQILIGLLQTSACVVNGPEYFEVVDSDSRFRCVRLEEFLDGQCFLGE